MQTTDLNSLLNELNEIGKDCIIRQSEPTSQTFKDVISYMETINSCFIIEIKDNIVFVSSEMFYISFLASEVQWLRLTKYELQFEHCDFTFILSFDNGLNIHSAM